MPYTPTPEDIRCANCREWYHKTLRACPMCDAPNVPHAGPARAPQQQAHPPKQAHQSTQRPKKKIATYADVRASANEINVNQGTAGCSATVGILLCLTGIGALIGVPMIIMSLIEQNKSSRGIVKVLRGECPYCGKLLDVKGEVSAVECAFCKKSFMVKKMLLGGEFIPY